MTRASPLYSDRRCNVRRWVSGFKTMFAWPPGLIAGRFLFSGGGEWGLGKKASGQRNNSANESRHRAEDQHNRSEEHTSELQSLMRISYAVFCLNKKTP